MDTELRKELERAIQLYIKIYKHLQSPMKGEKPDPRDVKQSAMILKEIHRLNNILEL